MGLEVEVVGETNKFDVIVIGGGIAGMIASTIVTNSKLKSCFIEKEVPGGKLLQIEKVHNFSQCPDIKGADLAVGIFNSAVEENKTNYSNGNVVSMKSKNDLFYLYTEDGIAWECKAVIVATGTIVKKLDIPSEEKFANNGISYCVLCDAGLTVGKNVALIGSRLHAEHLSKANHVEFIQPNDVKEFVGRDKLEGIVLKNGNSVKCDMVFIQLGFTTSNKFLIQDVKKNNNGEIVVNEQMHATYPGVFACGDCTSVGPKLIETATEQARIAAIEAANYVKSRKW